MHENINKSIKICTEKQIVVQHIILIVTVMCNNKHIQFLLKVHGQMNIYAELCNTFYYFLIPFLKIL